MIAWPCFRSISPHYLLIGDANPEYVSEAWMLWQKDAIFVLHGHDGGGYYLMML